MICYLKLFQYIYNPSIVRIRTGRSERTISKKIAEQNITPIVPTTFAEVRLSSTLTNFRSLTVVFFVLTVSSSNASSSSSSTSSVVLLVFVRPAISAACSHVHGHHTGIADDIMILTDDAGVEELSKIDELGKSFVDFKVWLEAKADDMDKVNEDDEG